MKVILLIGKICCGKTTYARTLGGMLISCDQLMQTLFPDRFFYHCAHQKR